MAWTTPHAFQTNELVSATNFNRYIRDNLKFLIIPLSTSTAKIRSITADCFDSLDGSALTNVVPLAQDNVMTGAIGISGTGRLVLPYGSNLYAVA